MKFKLEEKSRRSNTVGVITELGIGNFKAFGETQRVPVRPLTLIFGPNSSGKSSIIHSLLLAHHGLETGRWDAHQTALGGESVDLGGFTNYVHKHDPERMVTLGFETETDFDDLRQSSDSQDQRMHLAGEDEEKAPFKFAARFGFRFYLTPNVFILPGGQPKYREGLDIQKVEVLVNSQPALTLSRDFAPLLFTPALALPCNPVLLAAFASMVRFSRLFQAKKELLQAPAEMRKKAQQELEMLCRNLREWEHGLTAGSFETMREEPDMAGLQEAYARMLQDRQFFFEKLVLRDNDEYDDWCWAGWRDQLLDGQYGGVLGFFMDYAGDDHAAGDWWAEAQAVRFNFSRFLNFYSEKIAQTLRTLTYLGPLRCVPPRHVGGVRDQDPNWLAAGGAAWERARQDPRVLEVLNEWLGPKRLNTSYRVIAKRLVEAEELLQALKEEPGAYGRPPHLAAEEALRNKPELATLTELLFEDTKSKTVVSHRDIGFGVSQVVPVLVTALASNQKLIAVEQPELHLHPALQAHLGDVFIESALGERKNAFVLETHSEHLILRILRRVRETTEKRLPAGATAIRPEDISVVFVKPTAKGSVVECLPVTADGDFGAPWPGGFFADRLEDLP